NVKSIRNKNKKDVNANDVCNEVLDSQNDEHVEKMNDSQTKVIRETVKVERDMNDVNYKVNEEVEGTDMATESDNSRNSQNADSHKDNDEGPRTVDEFMTITNDLKQKQVNVDFVQVQHRKRGAKKVNVRDGNKKDTKGIKSNNVMYKPVEKEQLSGGSNAKSVETRKGGSSIICLTLDSPVRSGRQSLLAKALEDANGLSEKYLSNVEYLTCELDQFQLHMVDPFTSHFLRSIGANTPSRMPERGTCRKVVDDTSEDLDALGDRTVRQSAGSHELTMWHRAV
ncbi:hypothetical protein Tco_0640077, partial [Tanacetum coccineum]